MSTTTTTEAASYYEHSSPTPNESEPEVSVVMPCLNEARTLETCIKKADKSLKQLRISGEIIVADNGSSDGSQLIAS